MDRPRVAALAVLACLAGLPEAWGQIRVQPVIPDCWAHSLLEDREGFLWVGTAAGLVRFDGVEKEGFDPSETVPTGQVWAIHQAPGGEIYFATATGLGIYENGEFKRPPQASGLRDRRVNAIAESAGGGVIFARDRDLVKLRPDGRFETIRLDVESRIWSVLEARDGTLYVGTEESGLLVVREGKARSLTAKDGLAAGPVRALLQGKDGTVYAGADGVSLLRGDRIETPRSPVSAVRSIVEASDGTLYMASFFGGVWIARGGSFEALDRLTAAHGLSDDRVSALILGRDGTLYIGSEAVTAYRGDVFQGWPKKQGRVPEDVWAIAEDTRGNLYAGTDQGLAVLRGPRWEALDSRHGLPTGVIRSLLAPPEGGLYLGSQKPHGAWFYDGTRTRPFLWDDGLPSRQVFALHQGRDGSLYLGTLDGLFAYRNGRLDHLFDGERINSVHSAPDGAVWAGTEGRGLLRWKDGRLKFWTQKDGLHDDIVTAVRMTRDGSVYAGTVSSLSVLREDRVQHSFENHSEGFAYGPVRCILEDRSGLIYVLSDLGVSVIQPETAGPPALVRRLSEPDGLVGPGGLASACHQDAEGRLWFGGASGISVYDPRKEKRLPKPPRAYLREWRLFNEKIALPLAREPRKAFQGHDRYNLTFSYSAIDLAAGHRVRFRSRLAGFEQEWNPPTNESSVRYTNVEPGDYRFEVQASNDGGKRWSAPATLPFTIQPPPWWKDPRWALSLSALLLIGAVGSVSVYRVRQLLAVERLRTSLAANLHDDVGAGLTEIAILSEVAARRGGEAPPELDRVADTARRLVDRMNDIVWLVNPRRDSLYDLFVQLKDGYSDLLAQAGIVLAVDDLAPLQGIRLSMEVRENLFLIFKEALRNVLRHSGAREARLALGLDGRRLEVTLRDDGRGFDPESAGTGDGLPNMQRRAAAIGGSLDIQSAPDRGTLVRFTGPLA
jgi:signal transduction histidine kinase/ligand-binding sensor domain-containing protein